MSTPPDEDQPATQNDLALLKKDLALLKKDLKILGAELRGETQAMRADLVALIESRTRALFFSQIGAILAVAAIAFAG